MSEPRQQGDAVRRAIYTPGALVGAPVTRAIVALNLVIFALELWVQGSFAGLGDINEHVVRVFGANGPGLTLEAGHYETLLTSCFVHGSILHVALNMYALRQVGPLVERPVGSARFAVMYVLAGVLASLTSVFWMGMKGTAGTSVGASGAICGVMGAAVVVALRMEGWRSAVAWDIGLWLTVTLVYGAQAAHVDNAAHVGGLVAGSLIALFWQRGVVETPLKRATWIGATGAVVIACAGVTVWRDLHDPYASMSAEDRTRAVLEALRRHDCRAAREAMQSAERLPPSQAELEGLREALEDRCSRAGGWGD